MMELATEEFEIFSKFGAVTQRESLPDRIARELREAIVAGKLPSGKRVAESKIARQLGIGQPTAREALKTLENEGLLVHNANRGYCVQSLSAKEVGQIYELRVEWEPLAVVLALRRRQEWNPNELVEVVGNLKRAAEAGSIEEYYHGDLKFHHTLWKLSGNRWLERALAHITVPVFAFWMIRQLRERSLDLIANAEKHEGIAQALIMGDAEAARRTTRQAIESFWHQVKE